MILAQSTKCVWTIGIQERDWTHKLLENSVLPLRKSKQTQNECVPFFSIYKMGGLSNNATLETHFTYKNINPFHVGKGRETWKLSWACCVYRNPSKDLTSPLMKTPAWLYANYTVIPNASNKWKGTQSYKNKILCEGDNIS